MAQHRLKMMKLAVHGKKEFKVSTIELKRRGISYTVETLKTFKRRFPKAELVLIIGADNLAQFHSWKSPKTILKLASLAVYKRKGFSLFLKDSSIDYVILKGRMLCISSTEIRNKMKMGFPIRDLVQNSIILYINQHSLYSVLTHVSPKRPFHENHRIY
jgi:nicotinate-nucleotide adenylyltransferase